MFDYEAHNISKDGVACHIEKNLNFVMHFHKSYEFICCLDGVVNVKIVDRIYRVRQGKCILISPLQPHSYYTPDYSKTFIAVIGASLLTDFYAEHDAMEAMMPVFTMPAYETFCQNLQKEEDKYARKAMAYKIAAEYEKHAAFQPVDGKKIILMQSIIKYVGENYSRDISLKDMAEKLWYSYTYLSAFINDAFEGGFNEMVNNYRICRAERLLTNTSAPIGEIAAECGYSSQRSFNRNFMRYTGRTPGETREIKEKGIVVSF